MPFSAFKIYCYTYTHTKETKNYLPLSKFGCFYNNATMYDRVCEYCVCVCCLFKMLFLSYNYHSFHCGKWHI